MNLIELFCGCGGFSYGFEMAGYNVLLGVDMNQAALETFELNHKGAKTICGDITKITCDDIRQKVDNKPIDIIIGGPPCQGFSIGGFRDPNDPRNQMYLQYFRILEGINPSIFVMENVPNMLKMDNGRFIADIKRRANDLGYQLSYAVVDSSDFGVPQRRHRVIIVGAKEGVFNKGQFFEGYFQFNFQRAPLVTVSDAISDLPSPTYDGCMNYLAPASTPYQKLMRDGSTQIYSHFKIDRIEKWTNFAKLIPEGGDLRDVPEDKRTYVYRSMWRKTHRRQPSRTIIASSFQLHYDEPRELTIRESARLQSFPNRFGFCGTFAQQRRQVGNAVPPLMAKGIALAIKRQIS